MTDDPKPDRGEISYPCRWEYTVIGTSEQDLRAAIAEIVAYRPHVVELSRISRAGAYCSLRLELTVESETARNAIFAALAGHDDVTMVL